MGDDVFPPGVAGAPPMTSREWRDVLLAVAIASVFLCALLALLGEIAVSTMGAFMLASVTLGVVVLTRQRKDQIVHFLRKRRVIRWIFDLPDEKPKKGGRKK